MVLSCHTHLLWMSQNWNHELDHEEKLEDGHFALSRSNTLLLLFLWCYLRGHIWQARCVFSTRDSQCSTPSHISQKHPFPFKHSVTTTFCFEAIEQKTRAGISLRPDGFLASWVFRLYRWLCASTGIANRVCVCEWVCEWICECACSVLTCKICGPYIARSPSCPGLKRGAESGGPFRGCPCREKSMQQQRPSKAISSVQSLSHVRLFATWWMAVRQASLSITDSWSLLQLMSIESVMPSNHFVLCCPLLLLPSIFPSIRVFSMSWFFASGGVSASASVLPMNFQDLFPLGWTGWISLQSKGFSRVFSKTTVQKHQFFGAQLSLYSNSHIHSWLPEKS